MALTLDIADLKSRLETLGFQVQREAELEGSDYLLVKHPRHEGTLISVIVDIDWVSEVQRWVRNGPESALGTSKRSRGAGLTELQRDHLDRIEYGEYIDPMDLHTMEDLTALIQDKIAVQTIL